MFWRFAPESVWKIFLDVRSAVFFFLFLRTFVFWVSVLVMCFLVLFCLCFCFMFGGLLPKICLEKLF